MNERNGTTAIASGSLVVNGPRQIFFPSPISLANNSGAGESSASPAFIVPIPDARLRVKITVAFVPNAGQAQPNLSGAETIWLAACDYEQRGATGGGGRILPITDLEGTQATPTPFPGSADLAGYSREFTTSADLIQVVPTLFSNATPGNWVAQFRLQPFDQPFIWNEWLQIRSLFNPFLTGAKGFL